MTLRSPGGSLVSIITLLVFFSSSPTLDREREERGESSRFPVTAGPSLVDVQLTIDLAKSERCLGRGPRGGRAGIDDFAAEENSVCRALGRAEHLLGRDRIAQVESHRGRPYLVRGRRVDVRRAIGECLDGPGEVPR